MEDATLAHNTQGLENAMNKQKEILSETFSSAFVPVAYDMLPKITEQLGRLTDVINNNADAIQFIAETAANAALAVTDFGVSLVEAFGAATEFLAKYFELGDKNKEAFFESLKPFDVEDLRKLSTADDYIKLVAPDLSKDIELYESGAAKKIRDEALDAERKKLETAIETLKTDAEQKLKEAETIFSKEKIPNDFEREAAKTNYKSQINKQLQADITETTRISHLAEREINGKFNLLEDLVKTLGTKTNKELKKYWADSDEKNKILGETSNTGEIPLTTAEQQAHDSRLNSLQEELRRLQLETRFGQQTYAKAVEELKIQREKQLQAAEALKQAHPKEYQEELDLINKNFNAKLAKIAEQQQEKVNSLIEETADIEYEKTHSAFEKQLRDIEKWKQAQLKKAGTAKEAAAIIANAAAKEAQAFENEMDRIRGKVQSLEEKIFEQTHSQRDIDIMKLQKEVNEMIEDGLKNNLGAAYFQRVDVYQKNALAKINQNSIGNESYLANPNNTLVTLPQRNFANDLQADIDRVMASYNSPLKDFNVDSALNIDTTQFDSSMLDATNATSAFTDSLQIANQKIGDLQFNLPATSDSANSLDNITQIFTNSALPEISKQFANIAQSSQTPTNNITVQSPNINISLGGAYVFDNAMKNQLTNDISTEVATAIKSAVERATINNYGY